MSANGEKEREHGRGKGLPRLNFRPFLVAALGLLCGCFLYARFAFGMGELAGAAVFVLVLLLMLPPFRLRRTLCVLGVFAVFALAGAGGMQLAASGFCSGPAEGEYAVTGTVESAAAGNGYVRATLSGLTVGGERVGGKMEVTLRGEDVRAGDILSFTATVARNPLPHNGDSYAASDFAADLRYRASPAAYERTGSSSNIFLRMNGALYDRLHGNMEQDAADVAYALLTGNARSMDAGFLEETRTGGIAHVFAVSGLHIGMLYGAAVLLLGNHEGMVLAGDVRYTRGKYLETARQLGMENYRQLFSPDTELGRWLATRNTMLRIGRNLFVHAGLSARLLERNLEMDTLNARMSEGLYRTSKERREDPTLEFLYRSAGPVWYRGMVCTDEKYDPLTPEQTDALLRRYDADRLLVGHTIFPDISTFHDGRVIAVNVQNELNRRKNRGRAVLIEGSRISVVGNRGVKRVLEE